MGRKPIGLTAMSGAERHRRWREQNKANRQLDIDYEAQLKSARDEIAELKAEIALSPQEQSDRDQQIIAELNDKISLLTKQVAKAELSASNLAYRLIHEKPPLSDAQFKAVLRAIHPDIKDPVETVKNEATRIMVEYQDRIARPKPTAGEMAEEARVARFHADMKEAIRRRQEWDARADERKAAAAAKRRATMAAKAAAKKEASS